jgi:hypothetical protein
MNTTPTGVTSTGRRPVGIVSFCAMLAAIALACTGARSPSRADHDAAMLAWRPVACEACERSRIAIDARHAARDDGRPTRHVVARVRNLAAETRLVTVELVPSEFPTHDAFVAPQRWELILGPAGSATAQQLVRPRGALAEARLAAVGAVD